MSEPRSEFSHEKPGRIRKTAAKVIIPLLFTFTACDRAPQSQTTSSPTGRTTTTQESSASTQPPESIPNLPPEFDYFPEVALLKLKDSGTINDAVSEISWFNFTDNTFISEDAQKIYEFLNEIPELTSSIDIRTGDQTSSFAIRVKDPKAKRVFFLLPQSAPTPPHTDPRSDAATTLYRDRNAYISFVRVPDPKTFKPTILFPTVYDYMLKIFTTEACQSKIAFLGTGDASSQLGQELGCNSVALILNEKKIKDSYDVYRQRVETSRLKPPGSDQLYHPTAFPPQVYDKGPEVALFKS